MKPERPNTAASADGTTITVEQGEGWHEVDPLGTLVAALGVVLAGLLAARRRVN